MYQGCRPVLPPAGNQPQDEAVADAGDGARVGDPEVLGVDPRGIGSGGVMRGGNSHRFMGG
jgi:hypothetical protein